MARKRGGLAATSVVSTIPGPVGGWNARDPLPEMAPTDAVILENFIPGTGGVAVRGGSLTYASGLGGPVNSLLRYNPPSASPRLFAACGANIFDVSSAGAVGAPTLTGKTGDKWQGANFGTPGGNFLVIANGFDAPQKFDGSTWSDVSLVSPQPANYSGIDFAYPYNLTPSKMTSPTVFASRLWFLEADALRAWFLPVNAIGSSAQIPPATGGAVPDLSPCAQVIDLSSLCRLGGSLVAMAVWTRDGGSGSDDYAVFITTAGEALVFSGTDPTNAATWSLDGVFRIPPPVGNLCQIPAGADVGLLTQTGVVPLSQILPLALSQDEQVAITDKIRGAFQNAYQAAPFAFGWQMAEYPKGGLLIVNVPQPDGSFQQYVLNVLTQAWCRFMGLPAICWALLGDSIMFGTPDGRVCQYDVGNSDDGAAISAVVLPAFRDFKRIGMKRFLLVRVLYNSVTGYKPPVVLKTDYDDTRETLPQPALPSGRTPWGSAWGSPWGLKVGPVARWRSISGMGWVASVLVNVATTNSFRLDRIDVTYEVGDYL